MPLLSETGGQSSSFLVAADASGASSLFELQGATGVPTAIPAAGLPPVPTDNILMGVGALTGTAAGARSH